jgi:hypothetical protein
MIEMDNMIQDLDKETRKAWNDGEITAALCPNCQKRYYVIENGLEECESCFDRYWDLKCYRVHSHALIRRRWLRVCYKLKIPYSIIKHVIKK